MTNASSNSHITNSFSIRGARRSSSQDGSHVYEIRNEDITTKSRYLTPGGSGSFLRDRKTEGKEGLVANSTRPREGGRLREVRRARGRVRQGRR